MLTQQNIPNHHTRLRHSHHPNNMLPMLERNQEDSHMNETRYYGIVDNRIERLVLIDEMPGRGGYTYFHTYDTEEKLVILEDGQWITANKERHISGLKAEVELLKAEIKAMQTKVNEADELLHEMHGNATDHLGWHTC